MGKRSYAMSSDLDSGKADEECVDRTELRQATPDEKSPNRQLYGESKAPKLWEFLLSRLLTRYAVIPVLPKIESREGQPMIVIPEEDAHPNSTDPIPERPPGSA